MLALNCGFGPKDLQDLTWDDIEGERITLPRSKTGVCQTYLLWPETQELLDKIQKLEQNAKAIMNSKMSEEQKLAEFDKLLAELKENVSKHAVGKDEADAIESWYRLAQMALKESVSIKDRMRKRVDKEIKYLKFRSAEYDLMHDKDQQVKKVQKGTPEEDQWKKRLPLLPLKKPAEKKKLFTPHPSISAPSKAIPSV